MKCNTLILLVSVILISGCAPSYNSDLKSPVTNSQSRNDIPSVNLRDYMLLNSEVPTTLFLKLHEGELETIGLTANPGFNENKNLLNGLYEDINISAIDTMYMAFYDENVKDPKYNGVLVTALKLKSKSALEEEVNKIASDPDVNFPVMYDDLVIVFIDEISFNLKYGDEIANILINRLQLKRIK